jgi:hypothetical protein
MAAAGAPVDLKAQRVPDKRARIPICGQLGVGSIPRLADDLASRLQTYSQRRLKTVARALTVLQHARELEPRLSSREVSCSGAAWQMFGGTREWPACHTAPGLLRIDNHPLQVVAGSLAVKRYATVVFADCMLMPRVVNDVDSRTDALFTIPAFVEAAQRVVSEGVVAEEATRGFLGKLNEKVVLIGVEDIFKDGGEGYSPGELSIVTGALRSHVDVLTSGLVPVKAVEEFRRLLGAELIGRPLPLQRE